MTFVAILAAALLLTMVPTPADGKYVEGVVNTSKDMEFLARFVFEPDQLGQLWYEFKYPVAQCCYQMIMFNDDVHQWPYVRKNEDTLTCVQKKAQIPNNYNTKVTLNMPYNCKNITEYGIEMLVCSGTRHFVSPRPRWWFINVANCNRMSPTEGIHLQYKLNMTNGERSLDKHFSADERYTLQTSIAFAVLYFLMVLTGLYYRVQLAKKRLLHSTYQLFFASVCLQLAALIFIIIALASFASDGIEMTQIKTIGYVISSLGDVIFVLMLMLVGKGYTITRGRISTSGSVKLAVFISIYALMFVFLYVSAQTAVDPRDVMFIYDSPAALALIGLRCLGILWLHYNVIFTVKHFRGKMKFYVMFTFFFVLWFVAEPVMIGVANEFIPKYTRAKIVSGVYWTTTFLGHMVFLVLTRPDRTNEYFPYHIKTNQVAAMLLDDNDPTDPENQLMGAPLTRSLTNIFVNGPTPKVTVPAPYTPSAPGHPMVNNFVSASLHTVSESNSAHDISTIGSQPQGSTSGPLDFSIFCVEKPQPIVTTPKIGPNYSIFCVQKGQTTMQSINETKSNSAIRKVPSPFKGRKGKKTSQHSIQTKKSSASVAPRTLKLDHMIKNTDSDLKQRISTDSDFVEIPLDDLTVTKFS